MKEYTGWSRLKAIGVAMAILMPGLVLADEAQDRSALREIKAAYEEAINAGAPGKLGSFLSPSVSGVMLTGEEVRGFDGLQAYWKKIQNLIGEGGIYRVKVNTDPAQTWFSGNLAISSGTTDENIRLVDGREFKFQGQWTTICRKEEDGWKVVRLHAAMDPVDNPFVQGRLKAAGWTFGGTGLVGGLVIGFAGAWLLFRRRA